MRRIPKKLRDELNKDPFMKRCVIARLGIKHPCTISPQFHHVWTYAGKQINEKFAILPVCPHVHRHEVDYRNTLEFISLGRASREELDRYPKYNWLQKLEQLYYDCKKLDLSKLNERA